jgi:hypothetical protein
MTTNQYHQTITVELNNGSCCPQCGCCTFAHLKVTQVEIIFGVHSDPEIIKEEITCKQCAKVFTEMEYDKLAKIPKKEILENNVLKTQYDTILLTPEGIKEAQTTVTNKSKVLPQVADETLLTTTIMAMMSYTALCDDTIDLNQCNAYHDLFDNYPQCVADLYTTEDSYFDSAADINILKDFALGKYKTCRQVFHRAALDYILKQSISVIKNKYIIPEVVKTFWFKVLTIHGTAELQRESYMRELMTPSVF